MKRVLACAGVLLLVCVVEFLAQEPRVVGTVSLVELSKPEYPKLAHMANIVGDVVVEITVQPEGTAEAVLVNGHPMLSSSALASARMSRFECKDCRGPGKYSLVYSFKLKDSDDCCAALSRSAEIMSEAQFAKTQITLLAEKSCLCDPATTVEKKKRSIKCLYLWKCSAG